METKTVSEWFAISGKVIMSFSDKERTAYIFKVGAASFDVDVAGAIVTLRADQRIVGRKP